MNAKSNPKCDCDICRPRCFIVLMRRGRLHTPPMSKSAALHEVRRWHEDSVPHVANDRFIRVTWLAQLFHQYINR